MPPTPPTAEIQYIAETAHATWSLVFATWTLAMVTLVIASATAWIMWRQLQASKATIQLNLHLQLVSDYESDTMSATRSRVATALARHQDPVANDIESILGRLERVAYYTHRNTLDLDLVWNDFSYPVRVYWHQLNNYVINQRGVRNDKTLFEETEWLYQTLANEEAKRRGVTTAQSYVTDEELRAFLTSEARPSRARGFLNDPESYYPSQN